MQWNCKRDRVTRTAENLLAATHCITVRVLALDKASIVSIMKGVHTEGVKREPAQKRTLRNGPAKAEDETRYSRYLTNIYVSQHDMIASQ